ncbi:universal stress protein [Kitasatospora terrestris]|uniref:Universal stress protein n=1 Tax=Kitasatospora terrestris TaxID=258051 RepID=A0ABP9DDM8_9ACTN
MDGTIVVGFDDTPQSAAAAHWAAGEARRRGVPLDILQAWPWHEPHVLGSYDAVQWARQRLAGRLVELRAEFPGVEVDAAQLPEDAADALEAAGRTAVMLVLGSRGLGAVRGFLVGSVSHRVLGRAACPVVLVRTDDADSAATSAAREVVLALDPHRPGDRVTAFAFESAALRSAPLRAVHAWDPPAGSEYMAFAALGSLDAELEAAARRGLAEALEPWRKRYPQVRVETRTPRGPAPVAVVEAAAGAGLVVVGRHTRRSPVGPHLGAVTRAVVHHVQGPVAVVPCG